MAFLKSLSQVCRKSQALLTETSGSVGRQKVGLSNCVDVLITWFFSPANLGKNCVCVCVSGGPLSHTAGSRQGLGSAYHSTVSASPMPSMIFPSNYHRQNHSVAYQSPTSTNEERVPVAPIPSRRQMGNHYHPPNPSLPQRLRSPPPPVPPQQPQSIQMPSSRGTAFKKPNNSSAPPPYESLRNVINDSTNQVRRF